MGIKRGPFVAGINLGHDGGAAITNGDDIFVAISEERLTRKKRGFGWETALICCLTQLGLSASELDLVVYSTYGKADNISPKGLVALGIDQQKITNVDHHLSHALFSFVSSGFNKATLLVVDGQGNDGVTESIYIGDSVEGVELRYQHVPKHGIGIGRTYEAFTNLYGWLDNESGKTMSLAAYADDIEPMPELFRCEGLVVESALTEKYSKGALKFLTKHGLQIPSLSPYAPGIDTAMFARFVQSETERAMIHLVDEATKETGIPQICLSGGVALNCVTNAKIIGKTGLQNAHFLPPASDKGQAAGNALYAYWQVSGQMPSFSPYLDYLGPEYSDDEIQDALKLKAKANVEKRVDIPKYEWSKAANVVGEVAILLENQKIVGWFQGRAELGSRALGNRSILALPSHDETVEKLCRIKQREWFQPFAPSIAEEASHEYVDCTGPLKYMIVAPLATDLLKKHFGHTVHIDGTTRVQTVAQGDNPRYHKLLEIIGRNTGHPIVLNTSFNRKGEPMVETPGDAMGVFLNTEMDAVAIGNYIAIKKS